MTKKNISSKLIINCKSSRKAGFHNSIQERISIKVSSLHTLYCQFKCYFVFICDCRLWRPGSLKIWTSQLVNHVVWDWDHSKHAGKPTLMDLSWNWHEHATISRKIWITKTTDAQLVLVQISNRKGNDHHNSWAFFLLYYAH